MEKTRRIGRRYLTGHGALMLCLGLATCTLASLMTRSQFGELGYDVAVVLSISSLSIVGGSFSLLVLAERSYCPIANYLTVLLLSVACWSLFWFLGSAPTELRFLTLLAGAHGVVWSLWYVRLALYFGAFPRKAVLLSILAATTSFLGIALATEPELTQLSAVSVSAYYNMYIGIQILVTTVYFYRELEGERWSLRRSQERSEVSIPGNSRTARFEATVTEPDLEKKPVRVTAN